MFFQDGLTGSAWGDWSLYTASPLRAAAEESEDEPPKPPPFDPSKQVLPSVSVEWEEAKSIWNLKFLTSNHIWMINADECRISFHYDRTSYDSIRNCPSTLQRSVSFHSFWTLKVLVSRWVPWSLWVSLTLLVSPKWVTRPCNMIGSLSSNNSVSSQSICDYKPELTRKAFKIFEQQRSSMEEQLGLDYPIYDDDFDLTPLPWYVLMDGLGQCFRVHMQQQIILHEILWNTWMNMYSICTHDISWFTYKDACICTIFERYSWPSNQYTNRMPNFRLWNHELQYQYQYVPCFLWLGGYDGSAGCSGTALHQISGLCTLMVWVCLSDISMWKRRHKVVILRLISHIYRT